jgi:hypothetical protein
MWGTDATMAYTTEDGWVWLFAAIDHYTAEAWTHGAARGDRLAALQPVYDAVIDRYGTLEADVARGISLRHDWGPPIPLRALHRLDPWLGLNDSPAYVGEPETNGCAERFIRTLKEQCLWARPYATIDELRQAVAEFTSLYDTEWLIERHGHRTPARPRRRDDLIPSRVIDNRRVQGAGCCSAASSQPIPASTTHGNRDDGRVRSRSFPRIVCSAPGCRDSGAREERNSRGVRTWIWPIRTRVSRS